MRQVWTYHELVTDKRACDTDFWNIFCLHQIQILHVIRAPLSSSESFRCSFSCPEPRAPPPQSSQRGPNRDEEGSVLLLLPPSLRLLQHISGELQHRETGNELNPNQPAC